ncbi:hypothetical protein L227DRAFT_420797 [Lentinus tigrinus ALCF2SS1-6]|uniref:Uncharacterized protein n=1 Tax=Lentinus tigrinus ALCF2SS1-6 TaxID=1328759 RepID=A0A5C2RP67_9APHY|nr:hypothetical protein L227DRAFT_420797 [Lentinus tigrinus ALCF2SS1-6]
MIHGSSFAPDAPRSRRPELLIHATFSGRYNIVCSRVPSRSGIPVTYQSKIHHQAVHDIQRPLHQLPVVRRLPSPMSPSMRPRASSLFCARLRKNIYIYIYPIAKSHGRSLRRAFSSHPGCSSERISIQHASRHPFRTVRPTCSRFFVANVPAGAARLRAGRRRGSPLSWRRKRRRSGYPGAAAGSLR